MKKSVDKMTKKELQNEVNNLRVVVNALNPITYSDWLDENWQKDNMFPPPLNGQLALDFIRRYILGEDWYSVNPISTEQINCEVVHEILYKCSKKYRKEYKNRKKEI